MVADISKISNEFGWKPTTNLKAGLERTIKHSLSMHF